MHTELTMAALLCCSRATTPNSSPDSSSHANSQQTASSSAALNCSDRTVVHALGNTVSFFLIPDRACHVRRLPGLCWLKIVAW